MIDVCVRISAIRVDLLQGKFIHNNYSTLGNINTDKYVIYIEAHVSIGQGCTIGSHVHIMANTVIGKQCRIDDACRISPNVTLVDKTRMGRQSIIHPNCVIGSDGFGFVQDGYAHAKLLHTGYVHIGDCCEIGACNTIDRGT